MQRHHRVLVHVLLYSTVQVKFFAVVFVIDIFNVVPYMRFQRPNVVMIRQVRYLD
jgi:hypothetical protein